MAVRSGGQEGAWGPLNCWPKCSDLVALAPASYRSDLLRVPAGLGASRRAAPPPYCRLLSLASGGSPSSRVLNVWAPGAVTSLYSCGPHTPGSPLWDNHSRQMSACPATIESQPFPLSPQMSASWGPHLHAPSLLRDPDAPHLRRDLGSPHLRRDQEMSPTSSRGHNSCLLSLAQLDSYSSLQSHSIWKHFLLEHSSVPWVNCIYLVPTSHPNSTKSKSWRNWSDAHLSLGARPLQCKQWDTVHEWIPDGPAVNMQCGTTAESGGNAPRAARRGMPIPGCAVPERHVCVRASCGALDIPTARLQLASLEAGPRC